MIATITMCSLDFDEAYIDHFLAFYDSQGVDHHFLILHSKSPTDENAYRDYYSTKKASVYFQYGEWNTKVSEDARHLVIKESGLTDKDWLIHTDIDEQAESVGQTLKEKIKKMEANGENCCSGSMIDRVSEDGSLPEIIPQKPLSEQFPRTADIGRSILWCQTKKIPITKANILVKGGHHELMPEFKSKAVFNSEILKVNHYKWTKNVKEKLQERVLTHKQFFHWKESARFLVFWKRSKTFKSLLK
jgi:hypothetical protein